MSARVFIALGSNLGDREGHLIQGAADIAELADCYDLTLSSIFETAPMGPQDQPDYLNAVCRFQCALEAHVLLAELKMIERQHGRIQSTERWSARPLDLDILLFAEQSISTEELTVPHPQMAQRSFVLWPLAELDPGLSLPGHGPIDQLMAKCPPLGIRRHQE